jgi:glucosamine-6-phosphate deaminase
MLVHIFPNKDAMGRQAANDGATLIQAAIADRGEANIVLATGASQFEMLDELVKSRAIDWQCVNAFHLDEYVGLPISHPGSFRLYLWRRFTSQLPVPLKSFHYIDGERDPAAECARLGEIISTHDIDVAFVGIGENGHLAFNDPPADFEVETPYIIAQLDEACRGQQLGEGWFESLDSVPRQAISMSVRQIMKSRNIICTVPDRRKAEAVRRAFEDEVSPLTPASILQTHPAVTAYLDHEAASLCSGRVG